MPILTLTVPSLDELTNLLAWPAAEGPINRIQIERSDTGGGAGYANIGTTILTAGNLEYLFYDVNGDLGDWYRWYYSNAANTFPSSANRVYTSEFQPAVEGYGLLCSVGDVKQRGAGSSGNDDELILQLIYAVSNQMEEVTRTWLAPRPASGTMTIRLDTRYGRSLWIRRGIRSLTSLNVATTDQPDTGGTFTAATMADVTIWPRTVDRGTYKPGFRVDLSAAPTGPVSWFSSATNGAELVAALGYARTPPDAREMAINAVLSRYQTKGSGSPEAVVGPSGNTMVLRYLSPSEEAYLRDTYGWVDLG